KNNRCRCRTSVFFDFLPAIFVSPVDPSCKSTILGKGTAERHAFRPREPCSSYNRRKGAGARLTDFSFRECGMKHPFLSIFCGLGLALSFAGDGTHAAEKPAVDPVAQAAAALYDGIHTETLPNGLRVYFKPIPSFPVVTTMVAYKVGSA